MQGMSSGSLAAGGLFVYSMNGSSVFMWIAIITVLLAMVFFVHMVLKRRKEAREARLVHAMRHHTVT